MADVLAKVFIKGGILAPVDLKRIIRIASGLGARHFQFGRRQELIFKVPDYAKETFKLNLSNYETEIDDGNGFIKHNIVSSFLANTIVPSTYWIKDGVYLDILDEIDESPTVRVNITDLKQDLVYSFTGDINFVASEEVNLWHVYLRTLSENDLTLLPFLVYSEDIRKVIQIFEKLFPKDTPIDEIITVLNVALGNNLVQSKLSPRVRVAQFYNYEGFHKYNERYWLGIYMREAHFTLPQLDALCRLCERNMIGQIHITPWKSLIIKDIIEPNLIEWQGLLAEHQIENGHSQSELIWQINNFDFRAFELKQKLCDHFTKNDICINGVIIGINNLYKHSFSHIIIREKLEFHLFSLPLKKRYDILYRRDFNPTQNDFILFDKELSYRELVFFLGDLIQQYHKMAYLDNTSFDAKVPIDKKTLEKELRQTIEYIYQCPDCLTVYDPKTGDESQSIAKNTPFEKLPLDYCCSLCETSKERFVKRNLSELESTIKAIV